MLARAGGARARTYRVRPSRKDERKDVGTGQAGLGNTL